MPSYLKIWIHYIWSVKYRENVISKELKYILYDHIRSNAITKNIYIDHIDGTENHLHVLVSLKGDQTVSKVAFLLKGESSHWINSNKLTKNKFEWQNEYIAISVSESMVPKLRRYIQNQETHHKRRSFKEEYDMMFKKYGFKRFMAEAE